MRRSRSFLWLRRGDWERGWQEYELRWGSQGLPERGFPQPLWDGKNLKGRTILLHAEQGLGDTIQFVRYAASVKELGGRVLLVCQRALLPLFGSLKGIDQMVAQGDPIPRF